jgi:hypothetical protein
MPAGDRTGPLGMGPMTGRGAGYCAGFSAPGYASAGGGRGWGLGRAMGRGGGRGRGWRHQYYATGQPGWVRYGYVPAWVPQPAGQASEVELLKNQAEWLKGQLDAINQRLEEIEQQE